MFFYAPSNYNGLVLRSADFCGLETCVFSDFSPQKGKRLWLLVSVVVIVIVVVCDFLLVFV